MKNEMMIQPSSWPANTETVGRLQDVLRLTGFLALLMVSSLASAQASSLAAIAPGVVVDASAQRAYLLEPDRLTARAVDSGDLLWSMAGAIEPLGLRKGQLLALREGSAPNHAELLTIDADEGSVLSTRVVTFPEVVRARLLEGPGERFQARLLVGVDSLQLAWDYSRHPLRGAPAVSGINRPPKMPRDTQLAIEPRNETETLPLAERVELSEYRSGVIDLVSTEDGWDAVSPSSAMPPMAGLQWRELRGSERRLSLAGRQFQSVAADVTLISSRLESSSAIGRHQWSVIDAQGEPIGQFESNYAFAPFARVESRLAFVAHPRIRFEGDRLIDAQDLALVVVDLVNGREAWQAALLDKVWREGMPP